MMLTDRQEAKKKGPLQGAPFLFLFKFGKILVSPLKKIFFLYLIISRLSFGQSLKIIHTNDLHSFFKGTLIKQGNLVLKHGGYSKISKLVKGLKLKAKEDSQFHLTLDAGDFYSGTIFHTLAMQAALPLFPEYEFFSNLEYDGITLGNHEFDGKDEGFSLLMKKVTMLGNKVPIISTNFINDEERPKPILSSLLKTINNGQSELKIGILGALGPDGCSVSQANRKEFRFLGHDDLKRKERWGELIDKLSQEAKKLKDNGARIVILLLHGGGEEDEKLAKKVKGLDVIIAGHTHENYFKKINKVLIAQAGSYGRFVGEMNLSWNGNTWVLKEEKRYAISPDLKSDDDVEQRINTYLKHIKNSFADWGIPYFKMQKVVTFPKDLVKDKEKSLGLYVMDKIREEINLVDKERGLDFYMGVRGLIRKSIYAGHQYSYSELFNILPLGFHDGNRPGYKTVSFFLTRDDFFKLVEFLEIYGQFHPKAVPILSSNLSYNKRAWGIPFINRIYNIKMKEGPLPDLVHIGTNTFLYSYMDLIKKKTFGLIDITPRDRLGKPLEKPTLRSSELSYFLESVLR